MRQPIIKKHRTRQSLSSIIKFTNLAFFSTLKGTQKPALSFLLCLIVSHYAFAQPMSDRKIDKYFISGMVGSFGVVNDQEISGFLTGISLNMVSEKIIYSVAYNRFDEFRIFGPNPSEYYDLLNLMIGKRVGRKGQLELLTGLTTCWGIRRTRAITRNLSDYATRDFFAVGITAGAGFKLITAKFLGLGLELRTHITSEVILLMTGLSLEIGKLR